MSWIREQRPRSPRNILRVTAYLSGSRAAWPWICLLSSGQCPGSTEGTELPDSVGLCPKNTVPHPRPHPGLAFHLPLLLGTTRQKNKALEIEEADDLEHSDYEAVFTFWILKPFKLKFEQRVLGGASWLWFRPRIGCVQYREWFKSNLSLSAPTWTLPQIHKVKFWLCRRLQKRPFGPLFNSYCCLKAL